MQTDIQQRVVDHGMHALSAVSEGADPSTQHASMHTAAHANFFRSSWNARKKLTDVADLKASIAAQGLLQNLVGYKELVDGRETGRIGVAAGDRRWTSIGQLIDEGILPADYRIPYLLVTEAEAVDLSLAENLGREEMHPADMFEAMLTMTKLGRSVEDIGFKFNVDTATVKKRLKLANVAPRLLALYREDEANFDQMIALAISDDHAAQEQAWDSLGKFNRSAYEIRRLLTAQQVNVRTDRVARFVGVHAFEQAGGVVIRDLFSHPDDGYVSDVAMLERLALEKLEKQRAKLLKQGVKWVDLALRADHSTTSGYLPVRTARATLSDEQRARLEELNTNIGQIETRIDLLDDNAEDDYLRLDAERSALERERHAIHAAQSSAPVQEDVALAGAFVTLDEYGGVVIKRDVIRPADKVKMVKLAGDGEAAKAGRRNQSVHSDRLTFELTSQRTAALQAEMIDRPDIALVYLTYTFLRKVLLTCPGNTLAKVSAGGAVLADVARASRASDAVRERRTQWLERLPDNSRDDAWLEWLAGQSTAVVMEAMAFCVATTLDATQQREGESPAFDTLARGLQLDMRKWWTATAADYFAHVSKERMMAVVTEAVSAEAAVPLEKLKKGVAADAAARLVADTGWLPKPLRAV